MKKTSLPDGTALFCIHASEAKVLDYHVAGYFQHGISLKDHDIVFDVGANIGVFGVRATQRFPNTQVYAFEPIPDIFAVLSANANLTPGRFHVFRNGVSKGPGELRFTYFPNAPALSTATPEMWDDNPGALEQATHSQMKNLPPQFWYAKFLPRFVSRMITKRMRSKPVLVQADMVTISHMMDQQNVARIDLLKVDCEGAEYDVLLGIEDRHWPTINQAVVEVFDIDNRLQKITELLKSKGFSVVAEEEDALRDSKLYNVFAVRS